MGDICTAMYNTEKKHTGWAGLDAAGIYLFLYIFHSYLVSILDQGKGKRTSSQSKTGNRAGLHNNATSLLSSSSSITEVSR